MYYNKMLGNLLLIMRGLFTNDVNLKIKKDSGTKGGSPPNLPNTTVVVK